ncbi:hypothetical protein L3Y34_013994 [Caenorhabditis briggsae]|uniref:Uncharacterized protein n=1 Tax=Caenorhabditis briggsae TaxID=6238 RepID=A0AAE9DPJ3_CAEBR|nr:hypothetical protein L3Y34_013994 [Caenorhabditis briggsae]
MKFVSFVVVLLITIISTAEAGRTKDAWPKDFDVTKLTAWPKMKKYFAMVPKRESEDWIGVPIQRRIVGVRFANGTEVIDKKRLFRPIRIFIVEPTRLIRGLAIAYGVLGFLGSAVFLYFCTKNMWKTGVIVTVTDLHAEHKKRECPVMLTLCMNAKKEGKTEIVKTAPGRKQGSSVQEDKKVN